MEKKTSTRPRIPVSDPHVIAIVEEMIVVGRAHEAARDAADAAEGAPADLAIAMWDRLRRLSIDASQGLAKAFAEIEQARRTGVRIDAAHLDRTIVQLDTTSWVVHSIGRYQGNATVKAAFESARCTERLPTKVMMAVRNNLAIAADVLQEELAVLIAEEIDRHHARGGSPVPRGRRSVTLGNPATETSYITFGH